MGVVEPVGIATGAHTKTFVGVIFYQDCFICGDNQEEVMKRIASSSASRLLSHSLAVPVVLTAGNVLFNVIANSAFKLSSQGRTWREFLLWQVVGNLSGSLRC